MVGFVWGDGCKSSEPISCLHMADDRKESDSSLKNHHSLMVIRKPIFANKEDANAREALKLFEEKQYKKALKLVDQNLKKNSSHAESLALKGCCCFHTGHKAEGETFIKKALSKEPMNYFVNHLAGIFYRSSDNHAEAAKWLKAAVDNGLPNSFIYRDLCLLQSQVRDFKNLKDSRQKFLESQPGYRSNWTGLAVSHHLTKDYDGAVNTLSKIEDIIREHLQELDRYEQSECVLYKNAIIAEAGDYARALETLEKDDAEIRDRSSFLEMKAKYLLLLGKKKEASLLYRTLLQRNPDNAGYYHLLETALETSNGPLEVRLALYDKLASFYPKSDPPHFLPLGFLPASHPEFKKRASSYILSQLKKGVPSAFVNIKPLYKNKQKLLVVDSIVHEFLQNEVPKLIPTVFVWTNYFLAQHYLYLKKYQEAYDYIQRAIEHSPTLVELYIVKARVVKHMNKLEEASEIMEQGRQLDLQDRFINTKTAKYNLRANKIDQAVDLVTLFTKLDENAVNGLKDFHTLQANWVLIESAESYDRLYHAKLQEIQSLLEESEIIDAYDWADVYRGLALKRFNAVVKIFRTFSLDQFDFHSYCMRRGTPRDYLDMLKWEDKLHSTPVYVRAVRGLSKIYWEIYEDQQKEHGDDDKKGSNNKKNKKVKSNNLKKKAALIEKVESEKDDADPLGAKLLQELKEDKNPLARLDEFAKQLTKEAGDYAFSQELAFDVNRKEGRFVLALLALKALAKIGSNSHADVTKRVDILKQDLDNDKGANAAIVKVVQKGLESAFGSA